MARCELRVSCINIKKISKIKNISQFGLEPNVRERERGGRKKTSFYDDFTGFCRSELDRSRVKATLRDERYAWVPESQDFAKVLVRVFTEIEKRQYPRKSRYLR